MRKQRRGSRAGFIIFFGWRTISTRDGTPEMRGPCPECGEADARLVGKVRRRWFTLFFLPVLPLESTGEGHRHSQCKECKQLFDVPIEQLVRRAKANGRSLSDTFAVYNELREQPNNGQLMLKLMTMYQELEELSEAETAARHFPAAMAAEPKCAQVLNRMRHPQ